MPNSLYCIRVLINFCNILLLSLSLNAVGAVWKCILACPILKTFYLAYDCIISHLKKLFPPCLFGTKSNAFSRVSLNAFISASIQKKASDSLEYNSLDIFVFCFLAFCPGVTLIFRQKEHRYLPFSIYTVSSFFRKLLSLFIFTLLLRNPVVSLLIWSKTKKCFI